MRSFMLRLFTVTISLVSIAAMPQLVRADEPALLTFARKAPGTGGGGGGGGKQPKLYSWMSPELKGAWSSGYKGQTATITVIDDFNSGNIGVGNLGDGFKFMQHGEWTLKEANMIAPSAKMVADEFQVETTVALDPTRFNVLNLSFGAVDPAASYTPGWATGFAQEESIISFAQSGAAVVVKSAGNESVPFGTSYVDDTGAVMLDYLGYDLIGAQSALIVGALDGNYSTATASLADYSNSAGLAPDQFLVVRVDSSTGLTGTSFAAPIVSGYAAILSSKFTTATPTAVANQLLSTARTDTINGYSYAIHGMGEASIKNALAPASIH